MRGGSVAQTRMKDQLAYLIASLNRQLEADLNERLRPLGAPIDQFRILEVLNAQEPRAMGAIAAAALVETPTLTKIIDKMTSEGLVYRMPDPADRRRVLIMTAPAGKALYKSLRSAASAQEKRILDVLRSEKAAELRNMLRELLQ
jgi:MarR family transcriptional regulator, organic hydroperoxide resistance regulator